MSTRMKDNEASISLRISPDLKADLERAAEERVVSVNFIVQHACRDFLDRLIPVDQLRLTRPVDDRVFTDDDRIDETA